MSESTQSIKWSVFDEWQVEQIRLGLEQGIDGSKYTQLDEAGKPVFDGRQMHEIRWGLVQGVDVSVYTVLDEAGKPVFDADQMHEIRWGLEAGIDVSLYTVLDEAGKPVFDWGQMQEIRLGLEAGIDVSKYADPGLSGQEMEEKRNELESAAQAPEKGASLGDEAKDAKGASQALGDSKDTPNRDVER